MGTNTKEPAKYQNTAQNKKKNGISAKAVTVVEVSNSRTLSSSRICEIKVPVERGRYAFLIRNTCPKTRSDILRSARLPSKSVTRERNLRITKPKAMARITPLNSTYKVEYDSAGITLS